MIKILGRLRLRYRYVLGAIYDSNHVFRVLTTDEFLCNRLLGEIVRNTHSIEKGLCLENVRFGFGYAKILETAKKIDKLREVSGHINFFQIRMFTDALGCYLNFHQSIGFENDNIHEISLLYKKLRGDLPSINGLIGGYIKVNKPHYTICDQHTIERIFLERHSVREFSHAPVSMEDLSAAIRLAMHCPSACNRQCYRVYIIDRQGRKYFSDWLDGTGGFADEIDKYLLITARMSDYRLFEKHQYIVSAAMFAAYLTLALQAYNLGACCIQRELVVDSKYTNIARGLHIPSDEMPVCVIGVGNFKDVYKVPVSHRFDYDEIVRNLGGVIPNLG